MYCIKCGKKIPDSAKFCPKCGTAVNITIEADNTPDDLPSLVAAAQDGNPLAMEDLIRRSQDTVYYNCLKLLRDDSAAQDVSQEVFITVFRRLDTLQNPGAYMAWVRQIAVNRCKNRLTQTDRLIFLDDEVTPDGDAMTMFPDEDEQVMPEAALDTDETRNMIVALIDQLPEPQRVCVLMYYYDEMSVGEIARELGVNENTVKSRLYLARQKLKDGVEQYEREGVKLYSAAPAALLAFLRHFLQKDAEGSISPESGALLRRAVMQELSNTAASQAAGEAVKASVSGTGKAAAGGAAKAGGSLTAKIIAGVAAAAVLIGGGAAVIHNRTTTQPEPTPEAVTETAAPTETPEPTQTPEPTAEPLEAPVAVEETAEPAPTAYPGSTAADEAIIAKLEEIVASGEGSEEWFAVYHGEIEDDYVLFAIADMDADGENELATFYLSTHRPTGIMDYCMDVYDYQNGTLAVSERAYTQTLDVMEKFVVYDTGVIEYGGGNFISPLNDVVDDYLLERYGYITGGYDWALVDYFDFENSYAIADCNEKAINAYELLSKSEYEDTLAELRSGNAVPRILCRFADYTIREAADILRTEGIEAHTEALDRLPGLNSTFLWVYPTAEEILDAPVSAKVTTAGDPLSLRQGPETGYDFIAGMPNGTALQVYAWHGKWALTQYGGRWGWCSGDYLTTGGGAAGSDNAAYAELEGLGFAVDRTGFDFGPNGTITHIQMPLEDGWANIVTTSGTVGQVSRQDNTITFVIESWEQDGDIGMSFLVGTKGTIYLPGTPESAIPGNVREEWPPISFTNGALDEYLMILEAMPGHYLGSRVADIMAPNPVPAAPVSDGQIGFTLPAGFEQDEVTYEVYDVFYILYNPTLDMAISVGGIICPTEDGKTAEQLLWEGQADVTVDEVVYESVGDSWYVKSGYEVRTGNVFYEKEQVYKGSPDMLVRVVFNYPNDGNKATCDDLISEFLSGVYVY